MAKETIEQAIQKLREARKQHVMTSEDYATAGIGTGSADAIINRQVDSFILRVLPSQPGNRVSHAGSP